MSADPVILEARRLTTLLGGKRRFLAKSRPLVRAVDDVSLTIRRGEVFGLVGESGCGKTTLVRTLLGLQRESGGEIMLDGNPVGGLKPAAARRVRRDIQYLHQDAAAALDPWWSVGRSLMEPLKAHGLAQNGDAQIAKILSAVGLDPSLLARYPHQLSGGQLRRVALARVLILEPRIVILDEPTAGLDLSVQASVLKLILGINQELGITIVLVSHDLSVIRVICNSVAVMYLGRIVERGSAEAVFASPRHPYTRALLAATPKLDPTAENGAAIKGEPPSLVAVPSGCGFRPRCPFAVDVCANAVPPLESAADGRLVACHRKDALGNA